MIGIQEPTAGKCQQDNSTGLRLRYLSFAGNLMIQEATCDSALSDLTQLVGLLTIQEREQPDGNTSVHALRRVVDQQLRDLGTSPGMVRQRQQMVEQALQSLGLPQSYKISPLPQANNEAGGVTGAMRRALEESAAILSRGRQLYGDLFKRLDALEASSKTTTHEDDKAAKIQDRKRDVQGQPRVPGDVEVFQKPPGLAAANRWGPNPSCPPPKRPLHASSVLSQPKAEAGRAFGAPPRQPGYFAAPSGPGEHLPSGDPDDPDEGEGSGTGGPGGFQSARNKLVADMMKKGQPYQPAMFQSNQMAAPRSGLTRPVRRGRGPGGARGGFVPPFVEKAIEGPDGKGQEEGPFSPRTLELLAGPDGELPPELQKHDPKLVETVCNEIIDQSGKVDWDDIAGHDHVKRLVQELVVWPIMNPHLFKGARAPPKGLLLFGPPGTGKTLIGKAIASNIRATFFSISASSLTSKWIGEGEKMVRVLFCVAGLLQPSVIFIDEIDSILSARKSDGEHEASRRLKTEMLVQMEGCDPNSTDRRVLLIGATNRPEELDEAARRRMPKQLYIALPCEEARRKMVLRQLGPGAAVAAALSEVDLEKIVKKTAGYSGSDMRNLIQEACQGPVRDAVTQHGSAVAQLSEADLRPVVLRDFQMAARAQRASVTPAEIDRYVQYNDRHGAKYITPDEEIEEEGDEW